MAKSSVRAVFTAPAPIEKNREQPIKLLWIVLGLRVVLFLAEVGVGLWVHSLSLLAVAGHMVVDILAIVIALVGAELSKRSPSENRLDTRRIDAWAALGNSFLLIGIAIFISWSALQHNQGLEAEAGLPMMAIAALGLFIKGLNATLLYEESQNSLNIRGVFLHAITDAANSISLLLAAVAVFFLHWLWADVIASLLVTLIILVNAFALLRESLSILTASKSVSSQAASGKTQKKD
jgi:cobalt-zinc-cadmium efflux system protein